MECIKNDLFFYFVKKIMIAIAIGLIVFMFIPSFVGKLLSFGEKGSELLGSKIDIPENILRMIVFFAGVFELISLVLISHGFIQKQPDYLGLGAIGLIIFTVLVNLFIWLIPFNGVMFFHNVSSIGGLFLVYLLRNHITSF